MNVASAFHAQASSGPRSSEMGAGFARPEIAQALGINENTVGSRLRVARADFTRYLATVAAREDGNWSRSRRKRLMNESQRVLKPSERDRPAVQSGILVRVTATTTVPSLLKPVALTVFKVSAVTCSAGLGVLVWMLVNPRALPPHLHTERLGMPATGAVGLAERDRVTIEAPGANTLASPVAPTSKVETRTRRATPTRDAASTSAPRPNGLADVIAALRQVRAARSPYLSAARAEDADAVAIGRGSPTAHETRGQRGFDLVVNVAL